jgi:hypothetical protein
VVAAHHQSQYREPVMPATNPYYTDNFSGQPGQTARAEAVDTELSGIQAGFDGVNVDVERSIKTQPGDILVALPAAASRLNKWLKFDATGQPTLANTPLNVRGAWTALTSYAVGDAFNAAPNGSLYYVNTAYTSGATFGALDLSKTTDIANFGGLYFANYSSITTGPATITAVDGGSYAVDSTGGNIVINLPTESVLGNSPINVTVVGGSLTSGQLVTINAAPVQYIMGSSNGSINVDVANASVSMFWAGPGYGWRLRTMG